MSDRASVQCVVFDIDDTLYLERDYVRSGFLAVDRWVQEQLGVSGFFDKAWSAFERGIRGRIFDVVLESMGVCDVSELVPEMVEVYRSHDPKIQLLPDARECLEFAERMPCRAAVTDGPLVSQKAKAKALGLDKWLDPIVFTAELGPDWSKPSPRAFEMIQKRAGLPGAACLYVADNPAKDFRGPASLGWRTVRIRRPGSLHENVPSGEDVEVEVMDLRALIDLLK